MFAEAVACFALSCEAPAKASQLCARREGVHYFAAENVLCLSGKLAPDHVIRDKVLATNARANVTLVLRSEGGLLTDAIDIAEHLERVGYNVVVDGLCASACAQFVFMAARHRVIYRDGIVAMHGGPFTDEQISSLDMTEEGKANIRRERDRFLAFYRDRKIGIGMTNDFPKHLLERLARREIVFWIPKERDYRRFNVRGVTYCSSRYRDPDNVLPSEPAP